MWRPAHGATSRPGPTRPANGYGRALGRPGPRRGGPVGREPLIDVLDPAAFGAPSPTGLIGSAETEAAARITP